MKESDNVIPQKLFSSGTGLPSLTSASADYAIAALADGFYQFDSTGGSTIMYGGGGGGSDGWNAAQFTNSTADSTMAIVWAGNSGGSGNITLGLTGSTVTGSAPAGGGGGGIALAAGTQTATSGTVIMSASHNVSLGMSNSSVVTAKAWVVMTGGVASAASLISVGAANGVTMTFSGGGATDATLYGSVRTDYAGTNTAITGGSMTINTNGVSISLPAYLTTQSGQAFSGNGGSSTFQTLEFLAGNGVTFSNSAGSVRFTHDLQYTSATSAITSNALNTSASRVINIVAATNNTGGGTASLSSNVSFSAANGLTFYTSAGGAVVGSYTVPTQSAQTQSNVQGIIVSNTTYRTGDVSFSNLNGISFGSNGANVVTASYTVPTQTNQSLGLYAVSNTTGATSTTTADARSLSFQGAGIASVGFTNGSVVISVPSGGGAGDGGVFIAADTRTAITNNTVLFSNANGVSFGLNATNGSIMTASIDAYSISYADSNGVSFGTAGAGNTTTVTASVNQFSAGMSNLGNTSGTSGLVGGNLYIVGSGEIALSQSVNGASATLTIYEPTQYKSYWKNANGLYNSQTSTFGASQSLMWPIVVQNDLSVSYARIPISGSGVSTTFGSTVNSTFSGGISTTWRYGLYTAGTGASSKSLFAVYTKSTTMGQSFNYAEGTTNSSFSMTFGATYFNANGSGTFSDTTTNNSSYSFNTGRITAFTGMRFLDLPIATTVGAGVYWMLLGSATSASTQGTAAVTGGRWGISLAVQTQPNAAVNNIGEAVSGSNQWLPANGVYTTNSNNTLVTAIPMSAVQSTASQPFPFVQFINIA